MKRSAAAIMFAASLVLATSINAAAQTSHPTNAQRALQWLQCTQQQPNGQIGSGGNPIARSSEVALSLAAAGQDASAMRNGASSLADFLESATTSDVGTNGELLMARLRKLDKVAYVRFASVYLDFKDVREFMSELKGLLRERSRK